MAWAETIGANAHEIKIWSPEPARFRSAVTERVAATREVPINQLEHCVGSIFNLLRKEHLL